MTELEADVVAEAMEENVSIEVKQAFVTSGQRLLAQGRLEVLLELLELKFGKLSPAALARLEAGSPDEIGRWVEGLLTADSLEALLN